MITQSSTSNDTIQNTTYTVTLDEENDELMLPIPDELMVQLGWKENDLLEWIIEDDYIKLVRVDDDETLDAGQS
jgi:hypothetical protein